MRVLNFAALAAAALAAGCGTGDDREQARAVVERFYAAIERDDGGGACDQLAPGTQDQLESQSGQRCREVVTRLELAPAAIRQVELYVTTARVTLRSGESAYLDRKPRGWRITAAGCKPTAGRPGSRPQECEVES